MMRSMAVLTGAVVGGAIGFFIATALVGELGGNGQAALGGLVLGAPPGLALGALVGWLATRRRPAIA